MEKKFETMMILSCFNTPYQTQQALPRNNTNSVRIETLHSLSLYILNSCGSKDIPVKMLAMIPIHNAPFNLTKFYLLQFV
ncbi:MAG TPA: hypothetical protein VL092_00935 [Chitinophagaceae bacterium]|nr:hypothetical protein [Chitinophagaceae bacterium]